LFFDPAQCLDSISHWIFTDPSAEIA